MAPLNDRPTNAGERQRKYKQKQKRKNIKVTVDKNNRRVLAIKTLLIKAELRSE